MAAPCAAVSAELLALIAPACEKHVFSGRRSTPPHQANNGTETPRDRHPGSPSRTQRTICCSVLSPSSWTLLAQAVLACPAQLQLTSPRPAAIATIREPTQQDVHYRCPVLPKRLLHHRLPAPLHHQRCRCTCPPQPVQRGRGRNGPPNRNPKGVKTKTAPHESPNGIVIEGEP